MKAVAKDKVVTPGRPAGKVKPQPTPRALIPNARLAAFPEPAYSLYSSDSQEQVASLHNDLDRYSALLSGILQADQSDSLRDLGEQKDAAVKSKLPASPGRKSVKKAPAKTERKSCHSAPHRAVLTTPRTTHHPMFPAAHSGVRLHPARRRFQTALSQLQTPQKTPSTPRPPNLVSKSGPKPQRASGRAECDSGGEDFIPVRDSGPQSGNLKAGEKKQAEDVKDASSLDDGSAEEEVKMQTVQYLLRELKALIIGEGSLAETLLRRLEQAMASPLVSTSLQSDADALISLQSQNLQLRRHVEELQQQLKLRQKAEPEKKNELCSSQVSVMQQDLTAALSQLHELQANLTELQKAHRDTQAQLRDKETINTLLMSDLEATRNRLLNSEREKGELATHYQRRLQEGEHLKRDLLSRFSSDGTFVGSSVSHSPHRPQAESSEDATERISHYLMSITHPEAPAEDRPPQNGQTSIQKGGPPAQTSTHRSPHLDPGPGVHQVLPFGPAPTCTMSQCDVESECSDWSLKSCSTLNTRDEAAFRDGLSALDTSIANMLRSIQLDRGRMFS